MPHAASSVYMSVCWVHEWILQKRMNRLRRRLEGRLSRAKGTIKNGGPDFLWEWALLRNTCARHPLKNGLVQFSRSLAATDITQQRCGLSPALLWPFFRSVIVLFALWREWRSRWPLSGSACTSTWAAWAAWWWNGAGSAQRRRRRRKPGAQPAAAAPARSPTRHTTAGRRRRRPRSSTCRSRQTEQLQRRFRKMIWMHRVTVT